MEISQSIAGHLNAYGYETITVSTSVVGLTGSKIEPADHPLLGKMRLVRIVVEGSRVRFRDDGTSDESGPNPTGSNGTILNPGDIFWIANLQQAKNFKAIRHSDETTDATLRVTYFR